MSGFSTSCTCPNCGGSADEYSDHKPVNYVGISCLNCGFTYYPVIRFQTLKDLNDNRVATGMTRLRKKPKQNKNCLD